MVGCFRSVVTPHERYARMITDTMPETWRWRELMTEALRDAQERLQESQGEIAARLGVGREIICWSKSPRKRPNEDCPRRGVGLLVALELARLAGWDEERIMEMAVACVQEALYRSLRDHYETLMMLPPAVRAARWRTLARLAIERGGL